MIVTMFTMSILSLCFGTITLLSYSSDRHASNVHVNLKFCVTTLAAGYVLLWGSNILGLIHVFMAVMSIE
jgi:hypothetical protein